MDGGEQGPRVALRQITAARIETTEYWRVQWEVENRGDQAIQILSARLPHGQFRSEKITFGLPLDLLPRGRAQFEASVRCHEPAGLVTENAFIILQAIWAGERWRVFVRVRLVVDPDGKPDAVVESITTQKVGFSGVIS
ncbi:MAG TPA: hypothetical protein VJQ55_15630 [Candidatus Binatia bacterium]|nr:hypothetical protein [Candidatus Binatia bacterium]